MKKKLKARAKFLIDQTFYQDNKHKELMMEIVAHPGLIYSKLYDKMLGEGIEYIKTKEVALKEVDHKTLHQAKEEWQLAWNKLMEALLVLERIEI